MKILELKNEMKNSLHTRKENCRPISLMSVDKILQQNISKSKKV